jgi:LTXXQ motif family protein
MPKQLKQSAPRMLVAVLVLSAVALPVIVEVAGANPHQNVSLGLQDALNISKKTLGVENEGSADPSEFFKTADRIPAQGPGDKVWTVQFRPPPEFPSGQPFGFGDHPPFGVGAPGFGPGLPEGGPPRVAPKRDCLEDINRQMGFYAYTKSKLQLTDGQKTAWKAVEDSFDSEMPKMRLLCETLPNEVVGLPSIIERSDFIERTLAVKLELVRALKVPMQQLVEQLTSAQRAVLDVPPPLPPF